MVTAHFKNSSHDATKAEIALRNLSIDLEYLNTPHTTTESLPPHIYNVVSAYERELPKTNPLLLAVASVKPPAYFKTPVNFAQIATHDAVRKDLQTMLHVLHHELEGTPELESQINALRMAGSAELPQLTHAIVIGLQRNVIASAHRSITIMHHQAINGLWSRSKTSEQLLAAHLRQAEHHLADALALFDSGDGAAAFKLYTQVMRTNVKPIREFSSAAETDFYLQFGASLGIMAAAGAAFAYTGGAALYALTGSTTVTSTTGIGAYIGSLLVGSASCTITEKLLSHEILETPYFTTSDPFENALEFTQTTLKTAAMVGYLRGFGQVMPLPAYSGVGAKVVNFGTSVTHEFAGLTSFAALTDGPTQAFAPETMAHTLGTVLGLRGGHAALKGTATVVPVIGALYLMNGTVPPAILSTQILGLRPTSPRNIALIQLLGRMGTSLPMNILRSAVHLMSGKLNRVENAADFARVVMANLERAVAGKQPVGFELEFDPKTMSRDQTHLMMARALEDAGYAVEIKYGARDFTFKTQIKVAPIILGEATIQGQPVRTETFQSNGTTLVSVIHDADIAKTHVLSGNQTSSLAEADALLRTILDARPKENYLIIAKDDSGDTLKMAVEITGRTTARLTGINGRFYGSEGHVQDSVDIDFGNHVSATNGSNRPQLAAILAYVKQALPNTLAIQRTNRITQLQVDGLGNGIFQIVDEVPPYLEAISAKMGVGEAGNTKPMVAAFRTAGFDGTRAAKMVGMHVHAEVARKVADQFSIAPALNLLRAFIASDRLIYDLFPSHPNRSGFIQRLPQALRERLMDPNYVTDATDPKQILRVLADYVQTTPAKYADLNLDNYVSVIVNEMGNAGILQNGQIITDTYTTPTGETTSYHLRVVRASGADAPFKLYRDFETGEVEITRNPSGPTKPTAELRLFDSIMDPDSVAFIAQFWGSFVYKYANSIP